jgi:hypothetical protein
MKKLLLIALTTVGLNAKNLAQVVQNKSTKQTPYSFMENKGQIIDQNHKTNSSVLYQLSLPGLNVSLKNNGFSYDAWMAEDLGEDGNLKSISNLDDKSIPHNYNYKFHRVDVEFLGANSNCKIITEGKANDYAMYYTSGTPEEGAKVYHYEKVIYKNLYSNIDLEFVSAPGTTKPVEYNFIAHAGADVSLIKMRYTGALSSKLKNGALIMKLAHTELIETIPASWIAETHKSVNVNYYQLAQDHNSITLGFKTNMPNNYQTLIIDPNPNLDWGTYYGGANEDGCESICSDTNGNIYVTGYTMSTSSISTTGAYQTTYGGGSTGTTAGDAFLVKLNNAGVRQWGTYLGGSYQDRGTGVCTDTNGNVYICGYTSGDAFYYKFNSSGVRLFGDQFGGSGADYANGICCDLNGNIYVVGHTYSTNGIASTDGHQPTFGGGPKSDAFLVKYNSSGLGLWGTYYGYVGANYGDYGKSVCTDEYGNVYMTGYTGSANAIATMGAFQGVFRGGPHDAFLVKFNSFGIRQWGTYYGGNGEDYGNSVTTDLNGNVYIAGSTTSNQYIATNVSHQSTYGGGTTGSTAGDAFLAKFNYAGARQWSTYYGGSGDDQCLGVCSDLNNNIYLTGNTGSSNGISTSSSGITSGSVYVAKFNSLGARNWGTYYGGISITSSKSVCTDNYSNIFITGRTNSTSGIATNSSHDISLGGTYDGFIARFSSCTASVTATASQSTICSGATTTLSQTGLTNCTWSPGSATTSSVNVSPTTTTTYTVSGTNANGCTGSAIITINVNSAATVTATASQSTICSGATTILSQAGLTNCAWSPGSTTTSSISVSPTTTTTYTVSGTNANGCPGSATITVNVNQAATVTASASQNTICSGATTTLSQAGLTNCVWSPSAATTSSVNVSPTNTTTYTVSGTNSNGCNGNAIITVTVNPLPVVSAIATPATISNGDSSLLTQNGLVNFTWSPGGYTTSPIYVSPTTTTTYTLSGVDSQGCTGNAVVIINVINTVGLTESSNQSNFSIYPNPAKSTINIKADKKLIGENFFIYDNLGKSVLTGKISSENTTIDLGILSSGVYLFSIGENIKQTFKVVKE